MITDETFSEIGVIVESFSEFGEEVDFLPPGRCDRLERRVLDVCFLVSSRSCERGSTPRAEPSRLTKRGLTLETGVESGSACRRFVIHQSVVVDDIDVHLLVGDAGVGLELATVLHPLRAMFDDLLGESFTDPSRDRAFSEVVSIQSVAVDASALPDILDSTTEILVGERAVIFAGRVMVAKLVDKRTLWIVTSWVDIEPVRQIASAPGRGDTSFSAFDVPRFVDVDGRYLSREVDVADSEARNGPDAKASISKEGDGSFITWILGGSKQIVDLVISEQSIGVDAVAGRWSEFDFFTPVLATPDVKFPQGLAILAASTFCEIVVVFEPEHQVIDVISFSLNQIGVTSFSGQPESVEIRDDCAFTSSAAILVPYERTDCVSVILIDIGVLKQFELIFELPTVFLDVVDVCHTPTVNGVDYILFDSSSPGTILRRTDVRSERSRRFEAGE